MSWYHLLTLAFLTTSFPAICAWELVKDRYTPSKYNERRMMHTHEPQHPDRIERTPLAQRDFDRHTVLLAEINGEIDVVDWDDDEAEWPRIDSQWDDDE